MTSDGVDETGRDQRLVAGLLGWYAEQGRDLPWRWTDDPYAVLVSEFMLQQTQVSRVVPRFEAWLERWPTVEALAGASGGEVLAEWSGLGYNNRALRLHAAAKAVAADGWPIDEAGLRGLPGIGTYTAAAVSAFAFGRVAAAVDVNQVRVLDRWDAAFGRSAGKVRRRALELVPVDAAGPWNHALMDLGATICRARSAACERCPVRGDCRSAGAVDGEGTSTASRRAVPSTPRERFEDTQRYVRGRVVAALVERRTINRGDVASAVPQGISPERLDSALAGLVRDGLVIDGPDGELTLPV